MTGLSRIARAALTARLRAQEGFTMIVALGVMLVCMLITAALFSTVQGDASLSRADLDGKRAYAAAQAGFQAYLYALNDNAASSAWWQTCANDSVASTAVPGQSGESYAYQPVISGCATKGAVGTVVDPTTGLLRMKFVGQAGPTSGAQQQRTIVASFRPVTPLSYLWYTVHETIDPTIPGHGGTACQQFFWQGSGPPQSCWITYTGSDHLSGPMYTQDEFLVSPSSPPIFGRPNSQDVVASSAPTASVCATASGTTAASATCPTGVINGVGDPQAGLVPLPSDNANLLADAQNPKDGIVLNGTTTLTISGSTATAVTCTGSSATAPGCTKQVLNLNTTPLIYGATQGSCATYSDTNASYTQVTNTSSPYYGAFLAGGCGDVYINQSQYSSPVTVAAADDIVVTGSILNATDPSGSTEPTGSAMLGLVADQHVRIWHPSGAADPPLTIDGSILTLAHSFLVDNPSANSGSSNYLTVHGSIAQEYRGIIFGAGPTGYLKNFNYDDRLGLLLPPFLFDLQETSWKAQRETLCGGSGAGTCSPSS